MLLYPVTRAKRTAGPNASDAEQPFHCAILRDLIKPGACDYKCEIALETTRSLRLPSSRIPTYSPTTKMIVPGGKPTSSHDGEDLPPPSYQESVPSPQLVHGERPTASLYAPPVSSRSGFSYESEGGSGIGFPEPTIPDGGINSEPPPLPPRDREKAEMRDGPGQRAFGAFSSMVWGTSATPSTSRPPNLAGSPNQDPLNPAPSAFTRPTPKNYAYLPFQAMTMLGIGSNLAGGFPTIPPPINPEDERQVGRANPQHPFVSHDVTEEDWSG